MKTEKTPSTLGIRLASTPRVRDNGSTTKDGPGPAALTAGSSQGLARRYEGAPN